MPKIKERPSRAQARIMQALADNNGLTILWNPKNNRGADWTGTNYPAVKREIGKPKAASVRKMKAQGWITTFDGNEDSIFWTLSEVGWEALGKIPDGYLVPELQHMNASDIVGILKRRYSPERGWAFFTELTVLSFRTHRLDGFAFRIDTIKSEEPAQAPFLERVAFEVKVDRSDWKRELGLPDKKTSAMEISHLFYFVAPAGVIPQDQVPEDCGLLEVTAERRLVTTIEADRTMSIPPDWKLVAAMLRTLDHN